MYFNRRRFIQQSALAGAGAALLSSPLQLFASEKKTKVRIGMIAVGLRGQTHLSEMLKRKDVEVVAMADPDKRMMASARNMIKKAGKKAAVEFANGPYDYRNLLKRDDIDAVIISTPWEWHLPQGVEAMNA